MRLRLYVLPLMRGYRMVANVTTRHLSFDGMRIVQFVGGSKKTSVVGFGFWCQPKERLNRELADVSRASLRLGRRAAGVGNRRTWQKLALQGCPKRALLAARIVARVGQH